MIDDKKCLLLRADSEYPCYNLRMAFHGIVLTDEDVQEVRALWATRNYKLWELADIFCVDKRYLTKVLYYEVRCNVPDPEGFVRREKRSWVRQKPVECAILSTPNEGDTNG